MFQKQAQFMIGRFLLFRNRKSIQLLFDPPPTGQSVNPPDTSSVAPFT
jgi:hypothetical protein